MSYTPTIHTATAADGSQRVAGEDSAPAYSCNIGLITPASTPTDIAAMGLQQYLKGASVKRVTVSGTCTSGGQIRVRLQKSANGGTSLTGGPVLTITSASYASSVVTLTFSGNVGAAIGTPLAQIVNAGNTPTAYNGTFTAVVVVGPAANQIQYSTGTNPGTLTVPGTTTLPNYFNPYMGKHDQNDLNPSGQVFGFLANRTGSNGEGISSSRALLDERDLTLGVSGTSSGTPVEFNYTSGNYKCPSVKQLADWLVVNLDSQTMPAGTQIRVAFDWDEQRAFRVSAVGDSTTALATQGYMNNGNNNGGIGQSGFTTGTSITDNLGSNGFRLYDFINNLNGVTYDQQAVQNGAYDITVFCYGINDIRQGSIGVDQASATNRLISLLDTAIQSFIYGTTASQIYTSQYATSYAISSISWSSGTATVTTSSPHGFGSSETCAVAISGNSLSGYNTTANIVVTGTTSFTYSLAGNPGGTGTGGTATFSTIWPTTNVALPDIKIILWGPNSFTSDDAGNGPNYYMVTPSNNTGTLQGIWAGLTLAQAAQEATNILYNAYQFFATNNAGAQDARIFSLLQKQAVFGQTCVTNANNLLMQNQIHPNARGQVLETRQLMPVLTSAQSAVASYIY